MVWITFALLLLLSIALNIPLGMWRVQTRKFSFQWFTAIHLAVPLIYAMRKLAGIPSWAAPFFIAAAVLGQISGGIIRRKRKKQSPVNKVKRPAAI